MNAGGMEEEMEVDELVGTTIAGKYRLRRLIGVGGMGAVYEGQHIDLGKKVAIKIIDAGGDTSAELATRFKREARAASAVESDGIVQVFDVGTDPDVGLYMVMELLQGEDLEMRLRREPTRRLDPVVVAQIGYQVARALVKAHGARVIHRDLKPANIFLCARDDGSLRVKILDFGISKLLASDASIATNKDGLLALTAAGVALGTPQYMSPEQAQGLTTVDHRCDVWGLGVVLYEALAGIPAFPELGSYQDTILNVLRGQPVPLSRAAPWVPEALARAVHDAIQHNVAARIADCAAFAARLEDAIPEAVLGASGPFTSLHRTRLASYSSVAYLAGAPPVTPPSVRAGQAGQTGQVARPITLGDDTQVVVRSSDPEAVYDEGDQTMLALGAKSPVRPAPKVEIASSKRRIPAALVPSGGSLVSPGRSLVPSGGSLVPSGGSLGRRDDGPESTGDPTMFQSPAWVGSPNEGPGTLKTGVSFGDAPPQPLGPFARARHIIAAVVTAFTVVLIGGSVLLLASRDSGEGAGAAPPEATEAPAVAPTAEAFTNVPAPPSTGTAAIPAAPATGAALVEPAPDAEWSAAPTPAAAAARPYAARAPTCSRARPRDPRTGRARRGSLRRRSRSPAFLPARRALRRRRARRRPAPPAT